LVEAQNAAMAAISSTRTKRPRGAAASRDEVLRELLRRAVLADDGVMQLTEMSWAASSLPSDLVRAMRPALAAE
jgi:hypothetical protein